jgi:hypothetical protein
MVSDALPGYPQSDLNTVKTMTRGVVHLRAAYTKGANTRDVFLSSPSLTRAFKRYAEGHWLGRVRGAPSQKAGHMTAASMGRFSKYLYREAGIANATSHSGRRRWSRGWPSAA